MNEVASSLQESIIDIGEIAARLRFHEMRGDDEAPSTPDWERGARSGLTYCWGVVEAARAALLLVEDEYATTWDPKVAEILRDALEGLK